MDNACEVNVMDIDVRKLNSDLPRGSREKIANQTGYSYNYVTQVLGGHYFNASIIRCALGIVDSKETETVSIHRDQADRYLKGAAA